MAVNAAAVISAATKIPSTTTSYSVEISHHQSPFLPISSISPPPFKPSTVTAHSDKKRLISAKATKSESGVDPKLGVAVYKPKSYEVLVSDAATSLFYALQDGKTRLEIEFPCGSSDEFSDANIQLSLAVVRKLQEKQETRACIVFPDKPEKRRASDLFKAALDSIDGITVGSLDDVPSGAVTSFFKSIRDTLDFDFVDENEDRWQSDKPPSLYFFINCSTRDLSVIEQYVTVAVAPYVVNYSGALFRQYPGPWQVMLKQGDGSYACVAESTTRFTLGETKEELLRVLGLQEEEGSSLEFLRRGYKVVLLYLVLFFGLLQAQIINNIKQNKKMKRKSLSNLVTLILLALMPFAALGLGKILSGKIELGRPSYICNGKKSIAKARCLSECKSFPFYAKTGECDFGWFSIWSEGDCVCYV
ncbi:hypothetical protein DH2020_018815 [Rehmannia glutinosa]|uniref:DUF1995 domain-containing protein n=1 Tax=Rehmannia glutinosa TaxID=99300 RepID=A0ABR0WM22_REHGL